jgi:endonuclease G, mitochondrial
MSKLLRWLALPCIALLLGCTQDVAPLSTSDQTTAVFEDGGPNARFGRSSLASADPGHREDFLIERPQYVLSYNARTHGPNWVSWRLRRSDIGNAARAVFEPDPTLPKGFARVTSHAYDGSGFDRGHMCPAKDRSATAEDCAATFYLTNVVPQSPASNQKAWERLESYCRTLTKKGHELHIACGPHGVGGTGKNGPREEIGKGKIDVTVPAALWKVIVVLPSEGADPRANTRVIAVVMPNDQTVGFDWARYRTSAKEIERMTGFTFFRNMPAPIAAALRSHVDDVAVHAAP